MMNMEIEGLLLSDGVSELQNQLNEIYGYKRAKNSFDKIAESEPEEILSYLKNENEHWLNSAEPEDDVTFVVIKLK